MQNQDLSLRSGFSISYIQAHSSVSYTLTCSYKFYCLLNSFTIQAFTLAVQCKVCTSTTATNLHTLVDFPIFSNPLQDLYMYLAQNALLTDNPPKVNITNSLKKQLPLVIRTTDVLHFQSINID